MIASVNQRFCLRPGADLMAGHGIGKLIGDGTTLGDGARRLMLKTVQQARPAEPLSGSC